MIHPLFIDHKYGCAVPIAQPTATSSPQSLYPGMEGETMERKTMREKEKGRRKMRTE
jgi:hypothetical protein